MRPPGACTWEEKARGSRAEPECQPDGEGPAHRNEGLQCRRRSARDQDLGAESRREKGGARDQRLDVRAAG